MNVKDYSKINKKELNPFVLIIYDTTNLERKKRMLLNRALHGSVSVSRYKGKEYRTTTKGILSQEGITKLTKACILADPKKAIIVKNTLKSFKVKVKEELVWR